eukprot:gene2897-3327_t
MLYSCYLLKPSPNVRLVRQYFFGACFNQPIAPRVLPDKLTSITFGTPQSPNCTGCTALTSLTFGVRFNQAIAPFGYYSINQLHLESCIGLTSLTFGPIFSQSIEPGVLPMGLKSLNYQEAPPSLLELALFDIRSNGVDQATYDSIR